MSSVCAVSPPGVVSLANGLAQSLVSLGRFLGPILGGLLWSRSIAGNPEGYAHGFYMYVVRSSRLGNANLTLSRRCALLCGAQFALSYLIK